MFGFHQLVSFSHFSRGRSSECPARGHPRYLVLLDPFQLAVKSERSIPPHPDCLPCHVSATIGNDSDSEFVIFVANWISQIISLASG